MRQRIAMRPDCRLDVAGLWGVLRINRYRQIYVTARLTDMADYLRIPFEVLEPTFSRLVATGHAQRDNDQMWLTPAGAQQVGYVYSLLLAWLVDKLPGHPASSAGRTVARWKPPSNGSHIVFWPNAIGMTTRRRWLLGRPVRSLAPAPGAGKYSPVICGAGVPSRP
jgi:hypothetical protein